MYHVCQVLCSLECYICSYTLNSLIYIFKHVRLDYSFINVSSFTCCAELFLKCCNKQNERGVFCIILSHYHSFIIIISIYHYFIYYNSLIFVCNFFAFFSFTRVDHQKNTRYSTSRLARFGHPCATANNVVYR